MKSIVRKRLVAFLSLAGFASAAKPATAQVLKGSDQARKSESTIKMDKNKREKNATADVVNEKMNKANQNAALSADDKHKKASSSAEAGTIKSSKSYKEQKLTTEHKAAQVSSEHKSAKTDAYIKLNKTAAGASAPAKKVDQASPK